MTPDELREALEAEGYSPEYIELALYLYRHMPELIDAAREAVEIMVNSLRRLFNPTNSEELLADLADLANIPRPTDAERLNLAVPWKKERRHTPKYIRPTKRQQVQSRPACVARSSCQRHHG